MTYQELAELKGNERIKVRRDGIYQRATFMRHIRGVDPAAWIAFDSEQVEGKGPIVVKMYTGLQFTEEYFEETNKTMPRFVLLTEDELAQEVIEGMETVS